MLLVHPLTETTTDDAAPALELTNAADEDLARVTADAVYDTVAVYDRSGQGACSA